MSIIHMSSISLYDIYFSNDFSNDFCMYNKKYININMVSVCVCNSGYLNNVIETKNGFSN